MHKKLFFVLSAGIFLTAASPAAAQNSDRLVQCKIGWNLTTEGRYDDAISKYNTCMQSSLLTQAELARTFRNRGIAYRKSGRFDEAIADFTKALELHPDDPWADYTNRGNAKSDKGALEEAVIDFLEALRLKPGNAEILYNLGIALNRQGKIRAATEAFEKAYKLGNRSRFVVDFLRKQNSPVLQQGASAAAPKSSEDADLKSSAETSRQLQQLSRKKPEWFKNGKLDPCKVGPALFNAGRSVDSIKVITLCIDHSELSQDETARMYRARGLVFRSLGRLDEAVQDLTSALELHPDDAWLDFTLRGQAKSEGGLLNEAVADFREARRRNPYDKVVLQDLGTTLARLGDIQAATEAYETAYEIGNDSKIVTDFLKKHNSPLVSASTETAGKKPVSAPVTGSSDKPAVKPAEKPKPATAAAAPKTSTPQQQASLPPQKQNAATETPRQATESSPAQKPDAKKSQQTGRDPLAEVAGKLTRQGLPDTCHWAEKSFFANDFKSAIFQYDSCLLLGMLNKVEETITYRNLGVALSRTGNHDRAIADFKRAMKLSPDDPGLVLNMANAYVRKGEPEKALEYLDALSQKNPDYALLYNNRAAIFELLGNSKLAYRDFRKANDLGLETDHVKSRIEHYKKQGL